MSKKPSAPLRLLTYKTVCHGHRDTVAAYYLTARQMELGWDGLSPLRTSVGKLTAAALGEIARRGTSPVGVRSMTLSSVWLDGRAYYFWEVQHGSPSHLMGSLADEVLLDVKGGVIEQRVKVFTESNSRKRNAAVEAYTESLIAG